MKRVQKSKNKIDTLDVYKSVRKDWGNVKPWTIIQKNKKKYTRKNKHKQSYI